MNKPTETQINEQLNRASKAFDEGSKYPGMSYEQGVLDTIQWMQGDNPDEPIPEEE